MASQHALNLKDELAGYEFDIANFSFTESAFTVVDSRDAGASTNQTSLANTVQSMISYVLCQVHSYCSVMLNVLSCPDFCQILLNRFVATSHPKRNLDKANEEEGKDNFHGCCQ